MIPLTRFEAFLAVAAAIVIVEMLWAATVWK